MARQKFNSQLNIRMMIDLREDLEKLSDIDNKDVSEYARSVLENHVRAKKATSPHFPKKN